MAELVLWVEPLVTTTELADLKSEIAQFSQDDGIGEFLQQKLENEAEATTGSWLNKMWQESYLAGRGSLQTESNFAVVMDTRAFKKQETSQLIANVCFSLTEIYHSFVEETFAIEQTKFGTYEEASAYLNFFRSCRIPGKDQDTFYVAPLTKVSNHVIFILDNHFYVLPVTDEKGQLYSNRWLQREIAQLIQMKKASGPNVTAFTGLDRNASFEVYQELCGSPQNKKNFDIIHDALVVISLDQEQANEKVDLIEAALYQPEQHYFSKTIQIKLDREQNMSFNFEHTGIDGLPTFQIAKRFYQQLEQAIEETGIIPLESINSLSWELNESQIILLQNAEKKTIHQGNQLVIITNHFTEYGKEQLKKLNYSPDGFFHMALQLAQYRLFGELQSVYEPVGMRQFYQGRTECARSVSNEKLAFIQAYEADSLTVEKESLVELFSQAVTAHVIRLKMCQNGFGVERHLFGLKNMAQKWHKEVPDLFSTKAFQKLSTDFISTSGVAADFMTSMAFAPVTKDGFGLYYGILADEIRLTVSTNRENQKTAETLALFLHQALNELATFVEIAPELEEITN